MTSLSFQVLCAEYIWTDTNRASWWVAITEIIDTFEAFKRRIKLAQKGFSVM